MFPCPNQWKECIICWTDRKALLCGFEQWTWRNLTWAGIFFFISISLKCSTLYSFSCRELRASHTAVFFYVQILCTSFFVCFCHTSTHKIVLLVFFGISLIFLRFCCGNEGINQLWCAKCLISWECWTCRRQKLFVIILYCMIKETKS